MFWRSCHEVLNHQAHICGTLLVNGRARTFHGARHALLDANSTYTPAELKDNGLGRTAHEERHAVLDANSTRTPAKIHDVASNAELKSQFELENTADILRRIILGPRATNRARAVNGRVYRWHFDKLAKHERRSVNVKEHLSSSGTSTGSTRPSYYRFPLRNQGLGDPREIDLLRAQIHACVAAEDYTQVLTTSFKSERWSALLSNPSLQRIITKDMENKLDANRTLDCLALFIQRLEKANGRVESVTFYVALLSAARNWSTTSIRLFLRRWFDRLKEEERKISKNEFIEVLGAVTTGYKKARHNGLAMHEHALKEILFGFRGHAYVGQYHLEAYLPHNDPDAVSAWLQLACEHGGVEPINRAWKNSGVFATQNEYSQVKGATGLVGTVICAYGINGYPDRAWDIFKSYGRSIPQTDMAVWRTLLHCVDSKPPLSADLQERLEEQFVVLLSEELNQLEDNLGIEWKPLAGPNDAAGYHVLKAPPTNTLFRLAFPNIVEYRSKQDSGRLRRTNAGYWSQPVRRVASQSEQQPD